MENNERGGSEESRDLHPAAERLRSARVKAGHKFAQSAARAMGVRPTTYTGHESGRRGFDVETAARYAEFFGVDPRWLYFGPVDEGQEAERSSLDIETLEVPEDMLRGWLKIEPVTARIVEVSGDYMYDPADPHAIGSLLPGDRVVIDTNDRRTSFPGVFAIDEGTGVSLKMLESVPNTSPVMLRITGRNPRYGSFEKQASDVSIVGRAKARISML